MSELREFLLVEYKNQIDQLINGHNPIVSTICLMYKSLFGFLPEEHLSDELMYTYNVYHGLDDQFGEYGKDNWFAIWHKRLRQGDFFEDIYQEQNLILLSPEERNELNDLRLKVKEPSFDKYSGISTKDGSFNDTYHRYLDLYRLKEQETTPRDVSGKIDMLMYNLIHIDNTNVLYDMFKKIFDIAFQIQLKNKQNAL